MINLLNSSTDKLDLITSAAGSIDVQANYVDISTSTFLPSGLNRTNTVITTAATTDIVATPGASTCRNVKQITIRNKSATVANDVTVRYNANGTIAEIHKATLQPGEMLQYQEGQGWGQIFNITSGRILTNMETSTGQRVFFSQLERAAIGTFLTISGTAYYVYVGRTAQAVTITFVEGLLTTNGAGAQTAEIGLFSTPTAPGKTTQTLTKIVATGTVDTLSAGATKVFRNTASFAQVVPAGTHLWAAFRTAMATTQPTCGGLAGDFSQAHILTTTGGGALTGLTTASGTIPAVATATVAPDLRVVID